jgi:hypothetical protein
MTRQAAAVGTLLILIGTLSAEAGVYTDIWQALDLAATPSGFPIQLTGDGARVNGSRSGRLRIVPTTLGQGYELQFDRTFGVDTRGRPEVLRLGGAGEIELSGLTQMTLGYSGRKNFRSIDGSAIVNNMSYRFSTKLGVQDAEITGALNGAAIFNVNPLGFYNVRMQIDNVNSSVLLDGVAVRDTEDLNFDIGPINVTGNIFVDGAAALLTSLGVDATALEDLFPKSGIDRIDDAIREQLQQGLTLGTLATAPVADETALDFPTDVSTLSDASASAEYTQPSAIPEPGTLLIMTLSGATLWYSHRRR